MESYRSLPKLPGVYFFKNNLGQIIYVGKAKSLRDRVSSYFSSQNEKNGEAFFKPSPNLLPKTARLVSDIAHIDYVLAESEIDALLLEANLIRKLAPKYNVNWKDGKSYPLIEITVKSPVPIVRPVRKETNPKAQYFGPYPTGGDLTGLLRFLRRIFPFVSQNHPGNKPCLRSHLGLCPCPEVFTSPEAQKRYHQTVRHLVLFLKGERLTVQKKLLKAMQIAAQRQDFETANEIKKRLLQLDRITAARTRAWEYESNPNLVADRRNQELVELQNTLQIPSLEKIECYDISNTSGQLATGAQVTFVDGIPDKNLYRRYRVRRKNFPNDVAMLKEVLQRRLRSEISLPQLFILDGGKGQLAAAAAALNEQNATKDHRFIALAKHHETIYTDNGQEKNLTPDSPALHLVQRLRDEAHRFSRGYHFLLRRKSMLA